MTRHSLLAAIVLCALLAGSASAQDPYTSTGWIVNGFRLVSNVTGHLFMSKDACEIESLALLDPPNFAAIRQVYLNGSNSIRPDGRTKRMLVSWSTGAHATGNPYFANGTALYNDPNWIGSFMDAATLPGGPLTDAQKAVMAVVTAGLQLPLSYMLAELLGIAEEIDPNGTNTTASGAPHALDEGFGVYAGNVSQCAPWGYVEEASALFGTQSACNVSAVNQMIIDNFKTAQSATISGNVAQYETARDNIIRALQVGLIQSVLARAHQTEDLIKAHARAEAAAMDANDAFLSDPSAEHAAAAQAAHATLLNATAFVQVAQAESYSVFRALGPFLHMYDPAAAAALNHYLGVATPVSRGHYASVAMVVNDLLPAMGITAGMVGGYGETLEGC